MKVQGENELTWDHILHDEASNTRTTESQILEPYTYLKLLPSSNRNIRRQFMIAFNSLYFHVQSSCLLDVIEDIIGILHNSSLLIDDIEDSLEFRRGKLTAHSVFGIPLTINCGNLMYFVAMEKVQTLLSKEVVASGIVNAENVNDFTIKSLGILVEEMLNLHIGQGRDIYWRDFLKRIPLPLIDEYVEMVKDKTGGLFRLSVRLLLECCAITPASPYMKVTNLLGIMYQVRDDYLNITNSTYAHLKGVAAEDLVEGKLSLPILHCLHNSKESPVHHYLYDIPQTERLAMHELRQKCIQHMHAVGSLDFTRHVLDECHEKIHCLIRDDVGVDKADAVVLLEIIDLLCNVA